MSSHDNILIQVRGRLQALNIKLWLEPYYFEDLGPIESEIEKLAEDFSTNLGITVSSCKYALTELQEGAVRKLASRKEYDQTGIATLNVRRVSNEQGTQDILEIKCPLDAEGSELQRRVAEKLELPNSDQVKCISAGRVIDPTKTLLMQDVKNNQNIMVIISAVDEETSAKEAMYDRIKKIKMDVEAIVDSQRNFFEMEDQDGNPVFLPPEENRAILIGMGLYEKARAALKRQHYDEALILLLEADQNFSTCNSRFLESIDNYALINLDIVWCYLRLKNVTQLPDAERRLQLCQSSFNRSYGPNLERLVTLKGTACPERALLMRLHLLQGVVHFHQNERDQAYEKFEIAASELRELKIDDDALGMLVEMGYEPYEARLGLRASRGDMDGAVNFILEHREKKREARKRSAKERAMSRKITQGNRNKDERWVNPRSVCTLVEMGFEMDLVVAALKKTKNDVSAALDLLQTNPQELEATLRPIQSADNDILEQLKQFGFSESMARVALQMTHNNMDEALECLFKNCENEAELSNIMEGLNTMATSANDAPGPSTSTGASSLLATALEKAKQEMESLQAYERFHEDVSSNDQDYLDLALEQEEQILVQYKSLLGY